MITACAQIHEKQRIFLQSKAAPIVIDDVPARGACKTFSHSATFTFTGSGRRGVLRPDF